MRFSSADMRFGPHKRRRAGKTNRDRSECGQYQNGKDPITMNKLKCSVTTCRHNQNELCSLQKIQVDGPAAMESRETCCGSYAERTKSARNEAACGCGSASEQTDIHCSAAHCAYTKTKNVMRKTSASAAAVRTRAWSAKPNAARSSRARKNRICPCLRAVRP